MSGTKWHENDHITLPPHLIAPLPGRLEAALRDHEEIVYPPFVTVYTFTIHGETCTVTRDEMIAAGWSTTCMPLAQFGGLMGAKD